MIRIIAGAFRGKKLLTPQGGQTRPTADRIKEALFSVIESSYGGFSDAQVLDLYAGSGALGLEALSRGAARAVFVESHPESLAVLRKNIGSMGLQPKTHAVRSLEAVPPGPPFTLVFCDPPYEQNLLPPALAFLARKGLLAPGAIVACETARGEAPEAPDSFHFQERRIYGKTCLHFYSTGGKNPDDTLE